MEPTWGISLHSGDTSTMAVGGEQGNVVPYLGINNRRRLFRAVSMEALTAYVSYQNANISRTRASAVTTQANTQSRQEKRKMKFNHLGHQFWEPPKTEMIQVLNQLEPDPQLVKDLLDHNFVSLVRQVEFPAYYSKSPFIELTNACPEDQALAYQHLVVRDLAKKGYEVEHNFATPSSTLLRNVVKPTTEPYQCSSEWPFKDVKVAKATKEQYIQMEIRQRLRISAQINKYPFWRTCRRGTCGQLGLFWRTCRRGTCRKDDLLWRTCRGGSYGCFVSLWRTCRGRTGVCRDKRSNSH
eukprot:6491020-Amphidinium_carterae.3